MIIETRTMYDSSYMIDIDEMLDKFEMQLFREGMEKKTRKWEIKENLSSERARTEVKGLKRRSRENSRSKNDVCSS